MSTSAAAPRSTPYRALPSDIDILNAKVNIYDHLFTDPQVQAVEV